MGFPECGAVQLFAEGRFRKRFAADPDEPISDGGVFGEAGGDQSAGSVQQIKSFGCVETSTIFAR